MRTAITITVRMKSKRLPLKVLRYIIGIPMIEHQINRLRQSKLADMVILCTSTNPQDDVLIDIAEKMGIRHFRGSEDDVLLRLYDAARANGVDFVVSSTADNPLTDPVYADKLILKYKDTKADFITCTDLPIGTFSYGLSVEGLEKVIKAKQETDTEIWGKIVERTEGIKKIKLEVEEELKHPEMRLTVDEKEDLELIRAVYRQFYGRSDFTLHNVVKYLAQNPKLLEINKEIHQRH